MCWWGIYFSDRFSPLKSTISKALKVFIVTVFRKQIWRRVSVISITLWWIQMIQFFLFPFSFLFIEIPQLRLRSKNTTDLLTILTREPAQFLLPILDRSFPWRTVFAAKYLHIFEVLSFPFGFVTPFLNFNDIPAEKKSKKLQLFPFFNVLLIKWKLFLPRTWCAHLH